MATSLGGKLLLVYKEMMSMVGVERENFQLITS